MKVVLIGNCQARPLAELITSIDNSIEITQIGIVHLLKDADEAAFSDAFQKADFIVAQQVAENYPCSFVTNRKLREKYASKLLPIINLYYSGYYPDLTYLRLAAGTLKGPLGEYHFKSVANAWMNGVSVDACAEELMAGEGNSPTLQAASDQSLRELVRRESSVPVIITDFIRDNLQSALLFHTMNHPSRVLLTEYAARICLKLTGKPLPENGLGIQHEPLGQFRISLSESVKKNLNLTFQGPSHFHGLKETQDLAGKPVFKAPGTYTASELVASYYRVYDVTGEVLRDKLKSMNQVPVLKPAALAH